MRDVAGVSVPVERERLVLRQGEELDRSFDDLADAAVRAATALGRKRGEQLGIAFIAHGRVEQRAQVAGWSVARAGSVQVHSERLEDLGGVALELLPLLRRDGSRGGLLSL